MASNRDDPLSFVNPSSSPIQVLESDGYLVEATNSQIGSASGSFQNDGLLAGDGGSGSNSDVEFGFLRPELGQSPLVGTVQIYDRHVFLCYKNPQVWPPHVEAAEFDRLPRLLSAALLARKVEMKKQTRLTICEGHDGTETSNGDILIFPDMVRYRRLTHFDVDTFVEEVLVKDSEWLPGTPETLSGSYVFVCSHGSRDRRCGVCGPALVSRFKEEIDVRGLQGQVSVSPCSHIGGHKYAGNVIIFSPNNDGVVTGHWYGYVTPDDVPLLLEQHIGKGEIIDRLWRGQMGLSEEDQKKAQELRLQLNSKTSLEKSTKEFIEEYENGPMGNGTHDEISGCCQGNESSSCCQNQVLPEKVENNHVINEKKGNMTLEKKKSTDKKILRSSSGKGTCTRKVCAMPTWFESWEREDTYAALAVVGAIVSVAIAYSSYKQLR
ncbi:Sucraseferredoxin-like [Macleaya cordata]|uniref:Sucraseferredoxin-like n=1 Tax=Macleaya cordata TaxID=56857 RepID=A0A200Q9S2_MACCD|nr:Sucraseferredoxin-like [Macleaya cordata]